MKWFTQKTIDSIQWGFIIGLIAMLVIQGVNYQQTKTYVRIYESQRLDKLKRENRELYDSIKKLNDVESGMVIKFREHYVTDTIMVDKFVVQRDTIRVVADNNKVYESVVSIYHYTQNNDTVNLDIDIKAKELQWCKADFTISDQFMIINREKDGVNQTLINQQCGTEKIQRSGIKGLL